MKQIQRYNGVIEEKPVMTELKRQRYLFERACYVTSTGGERKKERKRERERESVFPLLVVVL